MNFLEGQDFDPTLIWRIFSPFSAMKYRGLNHSAILPPAKNLAYTCYSNDGTCFYHQPPSLWTSLREQDFDPTLNRRIFSLFSAMKYGGLNHSAILPSKTLAYACHSNDGTCFLSPTAQPVNFFEGTGFRSHAYPAYI